MNSIGHNKGMSKENENTKSHRLHVPVLFDEILSSVATVPWEEGYFVDGTLGRAGHTLAILNQFKSAKVLGLDWDHQAIEYAKAECRDLIADGRLQVERLEYSKILQSSILNGSKISGCLLDLGVSSPQLDQGERGFSFYHDGPLDMRMDHRQELTAADIVNTWSEQELSDLFFQLGEVRRPGRVVKAIVFDRKKNPFTRTRQLAEMIERIEGWRKKGSHPATNYFLGLRLEVNQELKKTENVIAPVIDSLVPGGRFLVITFHSLEDRIVKNEFRRLAKTGIGRLVNKKVIQATWEEQKKNPRSRSAKLRIFEKLGGAECNEDE